MSPWLLLPRALWCYFTPSRVSVTPPPNEPPGDSHNFAAPDEEPSLEEAIAELREDVRRTLALQTAVYRKSGPDPIVVVNYAPLRVVLAHFGDES